MLEIKCIFCNVGSDHIVIRENGFLGRKCAQCGLIYISPRPSLGEIINLYGHDSAHASAESHIGAEFEKRLFARHHLRLIRRYFQGNGSILEIGAGAGFFLDEARKTGLDPHAIEFNPVYTHYIRQIFNIPCEDKPLDKSVFNEKKFDIIYHSDVVSHFYDPVSELKKMHQRLKKGGLMVFETGNLGDVDQKYYRYYPLFQLPDHLFFFSSKNVKTILARSGFELIGFCRYGILPQLMVIGGLSRIKNGRKISRKLEEAHELNSARRHEGKNNDSTPSPLNVVRKLIMNLVKRLMAYLNYFLRYGIGCVFKKRNQPHTMIVITRKI